MQYFGPVGFRVGFSLFYTQKPARTSAVVTSFRRSMEDRLIDWEHKMWFIEEIILKYAAKLQVVSSESGILPL